MAKATGVAPAKTVVNSSPIELVDLQVKIVGDTPLIVHAWSEKAKREMLDKQMKKSKQAKEAKNPVHDFISSLYWIVNKPNLADVTDQNFMQLIEKGRFGFPSIAVKNCIITAVSQADGIKKTNARATFYIPAPAGSTPGSSSDLIEIVGDKPIMREDMVRVGGMTKTADLRYRGEFVNWSATFVLRFNRRVLSAEQLVGLVNLGGFGCGLGEWRSQKNGQSGMFHVDSQAELTK